MNAISALTFRKKFGETIDKVVNSGIPLVVERQNEPLVVIYPYEKKKSDLENLAREERKKRLREMLDQWTRKWGKKVSGEKDTTEIIRDMRDNRYGKRWWKTKSNY